MTRLEKEMKSTEEKYRAQVERNQELNFYIENLQKEKEEAKGLTNKIIEAEKLKEFYIREN